MYFTSWLVKRMNKHLFNDWQWIAKYREIIIDEKAMSIILTIMLGAIWFLVTFTIAIAFMEVRPPKELAYFLLAVPVVFYIYNWIMALYAIFDRERQRTWETLKEEQC